MTTEILPKRKLGRTGFDITPVGFGAWAIGGPDWGWGWGSQDDSQSIAAIRHAVERGINWIDTAPVYGLGHSEAIVREALSTLPKSERPLIFTKAGLVWDPDNRNALPARIGNAKSLRREVEASLKRLGVEVIDLYQMHWPTNDGTPVEDYWATFADLKKRARSGPSVFRTTTGNCWSALPRSLPSTWCSHLFRDQTQVRRERPALGARAWQRRHRL